MGGAKRQLEEYYVWLEVQLEAEAEESQSRLCMSCLCKMMRRYLSYPLTNHIVDLSELRTKRE